MESTLEPTIAALLAPGKGILAADESLPTIEKRFRAADIASSEETRRAYRELLFTAPGLEEAISGAILFEETLRQRAVDGTAFPELLAGHGIVPGVKVDKGTTAMALFPGEKVTQGLDSLRERLEEYARLGARFSKWRAVIAIGERIPTPTCLRANALALAACAALSQEAGLVPIIEPEVLMNGTHGIERCEEVTAAALAIVFQALAAHRVVLEHVLLKSGMVLPGAGCPRQAEAAEIATATVRCLRRAVPAAVPGILFLSGGQDEEAASERLQAICRAENVPWTLSFSFGRALQASALRLWGGDPAQVPAAQAALLHRARRNAQAVQECCATRLEFSESGPGV